MNKDSAPRVVVVDDDRDMSEEIARVLKRRGYDTVTRQSADEAFAVVMDEDVAAVVTDLNMKGMSGIDLCDRIVQNRRDVPVIVVTGFGSMETAVATLRAGAFDFLTKPFNAEQLALSLERALRHRSLEAEVRRLRATTIAPTSGLIGESAPMRQLGPMIGRIAQTESTVLITAERGAGKELVARIIHEQSARRDGPFVMLSCSTLTESQLEAELFGYAKGALPDAKAGRKGLLVEASRGTLLIDDVADLPLGVQSKLVRALESRRVRSAFATSTTELSFDTRLIATTTRDLTSLVEEQRFIQELLDQLNVVHVELPPLRARGTDILLLGNRFIERFAQKHNKPVVGMTPEVAERLVSYSWPGNVRELSSSIERAIALARFEHITVEDLPPKIRDYKPSYVVFADEGTPEDLMSLEDLERRYIARVMEMVDFNKVAATKILGIDRSTLYRKLDRYKIGPKASAK